MGTWKIAVLPGDGIGPEVTEQAIAVLQAIGKRFGHTFNLSYGLIGASAIHEEGNPLPESSLAICHDADAVLLGAIGHPDFDNNPQAKVRPEQGLLALRKALDLYANIRPVTLYPSLVSASPLKDDRLVGVDMEIYRELTGGIYFGNKERTETEASDLCSYNKAEISRIAHKAFKAATNRRNRVTLVDKANVLDTSRLWRSVVTDIAKEYPAVTLDYMFVDNAAMQLIVNPAHFDVMLTENMFGDILSDEASVLSGSLGMLPSASIGSKGALFEPVHGSYPQAAGQNRANPMATILSAAMMLSHFDAHEEASLVQEAINWALESKIGTEDLFPNSPVPQSQVGEAIIGYITVGAEAAQQKVKEAEVVS